MVPDDVDDVLWNSPGFRRHRLNLSRLSKRYKTSTQFGTDRSPEQTRIQCHHNNIIE